MRSCEVTIIWPERCPKNWHFHILFTSSPDLRIQKQKSHLWKVLPLDDHGVQWLGTAKQVARVVGTWSRRWGWFPTMQLKKEWRFRRDAQTKSETIVIWLCSSSGIRPSVYTTNQCHLSFIKLKSVALWRRGWQVWLFEGGNVLRKKNNMHVKLKTLNLWECLWIKVIQQWPQLVDFRLEWIS